MKSQCVYFVKALILLLVSSNVIRNNSVAVTRNDILDNTTPFTNMFCCPQRDTTTIINSDGRNFGTFTSFFPISSMSIGEAYVWGGTDDYYTFLERIANNVCAGGYNTSDFGTDTNQYWIPGMSSSGSLACHYLAGLDCGVFVNRCLGLDPYQGIYGLKNCSKIIDTSNMKPGDLCVISHHVALNAEGHGDWIVHSVSSISYGPPKVQQGVWDTRWGDFTPYSIFPQFSTFNPANGETVKVSNKPLEIQVKAEGSKSIENALMWLDDASVTPKVTGNAKSKTIKYTVKDPMPGEHRVKVQCANVVNGIDYEDDIEWVFNNGGTNDTIKITDAIASYLGPKVKPFYKTTAYYLWGNTSQVVLAGDCNGAASWFVDDIIRISIKHLVNGDLSYWEQNTLARPQPPVDLSWYFDRGPEGNEVNVELANDPRHLNYVGCSALWLVGVNNAKSIDGRSIKALPNIVNNDSVDMHDVSEIKFDARLIGQNPCYGRASFSISLPQSAYTELKIFNINGQLIKTLESKYLDRGIHEYVWDGTGEGSLKVSKGVYLYHLKSQENYKTGRLVLIQ